MSASIADLTGIRAKLSRAKEHHDTLIAEWNVWCKKQTNIGHCYIRRDGPWYVIMVQAFPGPDIRFSIIAGDIIHNLRCALDHLVWQLVLRDGHKPTRRNEFPICESKELFLNEVKSRKRKPELGVLYGITVNGDAWAIIEKAQPCFCTPKDPPFAAIIGHLSNMDKHRTLYAHIPFMGLDAVRKAVGWSANAKVIDYRIGQRELSLKYETEVFRIRFPDQPDPHVHMKGAFAVEPTFGEGKIEGGYQVGLGLFGFLIKWVSNIIDEVAKLPHVIDA